VGGADLCFLSRQPDISLHREAHRTVRLFTSQPSLVPIAPTHEVWPGWIDLKKSPDTKTSTNYA